MRVQKMLNGAVAFVLAAALLASPALACGGHHRQAVSRTVYVCSVEGCETDGRHAHNGETFCGYAHAGGICDGKCAALCAVEDCRIAGRHTHDDVTCCGYAHTDGFCDGACAALCAVEGCRINGRHTHGGETCCGSAHAGGFCDGTCANAVSNTAHGGHHGHGGHC